MSSILLKKTQCTHYVLGMTLQFTDCLSFTPASNTKLIESKLWLNGMSGCMLLTHWGRVTHICVGNLTIIGSDHGLSLGRHQAIIWINAGILLIGPLGTNFSEIQIGIQTFSYKKMHLKMSSVKWRPFCLGLNVLSNTVEYRYNYYKVIL